MDLPSPRNRWRYGLTALACMPPASLTFEKALALVDRGAVPIDKRNHYAKTLADGWDITLWHRLPEGSSRQFASVAVWRYDRRDQHDFRWREDVLVLGFHVGVDDTPRDPVAANLWTRFLLELGDILRPDFLGVDLYDTFAERKGRDLTRDVFGANLYGPSIVSGIGGRLASVAALKVEKRPWGGVLLAIADPPYASIDTDAREKIRATLWA